MYVVFIGKMHSMNRCNIYMLRSYTVFTASVCYTLNVYMGFQSKEYYHFVENGGGGEKYQLYGCS